MAMIDLQRGETGLLSKNGMVQFRRGEEDLLANILARLHHESLKRIPRNLGLLAKSWLPSIDGIRRGADGYLVGKISTPLKYGPPIEYGRKPGSAMPPDDRGEDVEMRPIAWWVHLKMGVPVDQPRIGKPGDRDYQPSFEDLVYLVRRKIARAGFAAPHTEGWRFVRDTIGELRAWCMSEWARGIGEVLAGSESQGAGAVPLGDDTVGAGGDTPGDETPHAGDLPPAMD